MNAKEKRNLVTWLRHMADKIEVDGVVVTKFEGHESRVPVEDGVTENGYKTFHLSKNCRWTLDMEFTLP